MTFPMQPSLLTARWIDLAPLDFLETLGSVFASFDQQDSGNVCYGVDIDGLRYFVRTAGQPSAKAVLAHPARVALLHNGARLAAQITDPTIQQPLNRIDSPHGPLVVYRWFAGDSLYAPAARRFEVSSAFSRFCSLPLPQLVDALTCVFRVHTSLASQGWVACDFYDGCILFDFESSTIRLIDLDHYHLGSFSNAVGRLPGSTRFMAPEENQLGALITERTTVFNMGRCIAVFLHERRLRAPAPFRAELLALEHDACRDNPLERIDSMRTFFERWWGACSLLAKTGTD